MIPIHRREAWPQSWGVETTQRREGHGGLRHRWMVVGLVNDSVVDGQRSVDLALVQYRQGSVTYQRVLDTQRFLVQQEDQLTRTKGDVALNLIATYKALGGGREIPAGSRILKPSVEAEMRERTNWGELLQPEITATELSGEAQE